MEDRPKWYLDLIEIGDKILKEEREAIEHDRKRDSTKVCGKADRRVKA